jgi:hypothetical protein
MADKDPEWASDLRCDRVLAELGANSEEKEGACLRVGMSQCLRGHLGSRRYAAASNTDGEDRQARYRPLSYVDAPRRCRIVSC